MYPVQEQWGCARPMTGSCAAPAGGAPHCVSTATLVEPRCPPSASLNRTKTRDTAGAKGMAPLACRKTAKVGVAPAASVRTPEPAGLARQAPVLGFDWQIVACSGRVAAPVSAETMICAVTPTLALAT